MSLKDKVFAVTGGSRGFGLAIARRLVGEGAKVGVLSRGDSGVREAVALLGEDCALGLAVDVADKKALQTAFATLKNHFGGFDGLINNAGLARPNAVEHLVESEVVLQVNTNFLGTVFGCQAAIPLLRGADNPRIINISSASAWHYDEMSHLSIYAATKAAVERFTRDLRLELQVDDIGVTCIRPGAAWTSFADGWDSEALMAGVAAWHNTGPNMNVGMEVEQVADAVIFSLAQPAGVAVDLLELRPNKLMPKLKL